MDPLLENTYIVSNRNQSAVLHGVFGIDHRALSRLPGSVLVVGSTFWVEEAKYLRARKCPGIIYLADPTLGISSEALQHKEWRIMHIPIVNYLERKSELIPAWHYTRQTQLVSLEGVPLDDASFLRQEKEQIALSIRQHFGKVLPIDQRAINSIRLLAPEEAARLHLERLQNIRSLPDVQVHTHPFPDPDFGHEGEMGLVLDYYGAIPKLYRNGSLLGAYLSQLNTLLCEGGQLLIHTMDMDTEPLRRMFPACAVMLAQGISEGGSGETDLVITKR
jgi:hypothetical protein